MGEHAAAVCKARDVDTQTLAARGLLASMHDRLALWLMHLPCHTTPPARQASPSTRARRAACVGPSDRRAPYVPPHHLLGAAPRRPAACVDVKHGQVDNILGGRHRRHCVTRTYAARDRRRRERTWLSACAEAGSAPLRCKGRRCNPSATPATCTEADGLQATLDMGNFMRWLFLCPGLALIERRGLLQLAWFVCKWLPALHRPRAARATLGGRSAGRAAGRGRARSFGKCASGCRRCTGQERPEPLPAAAAPRRGQCAGLVHSRV